MLRTGDSRRLWLLVLVLSLAAWCPAGTQPQSTGKSDGGKTQNDQPGGTKESNKNKSSKQGSDVAAESAVKRQSIIVPLSCVETREVHRRTHQQVRASLVYEYTPIPFVQLRAGVRQYDGIPQNDLQNRRLLFLEIHGFL